MIENEKYPALSYYLRCYLNQDFEEIFGGAKGALLSYKNTEANEEKYGMIKEIQSLIESSYNEKELQRIILDDIDCDYYYLNEWPSCKDWLLHILFILRS
ncbi:contact-dependent growth inhibition system immunity protein [Rosenbergiella nectarea]|uniref:contact-dependent growth inhibition system immunity protein n=1 Tax=Rosenbergiella nectarea TaxID=988801 RepID=UPI001F503CFC|nr:contact-dependent growth inhibition system immunity protein [Rosenbergiella nectarea]